ncbi:MAG TPA: polysaccharide deacetylase family protein [Candidatus Sulfotelmatobacter sp.]|nr:polysaccharide deacetylase family protein [Candidatus Sulfotelmatobacter sp.]
MSDGKVVFLMYHELESPGRSLCQSEPGYVRYIVSTSEFRSQMDLLQRQGWRGVSVGEALQNFATKSVAITFDDGCETDLLYAAPLLQEMKFSCTFYITTGFLGKPGYLNHSQVRDLAGMGFELGCHSMTHAYLTDLSETDLHREVADAKTQLEQILGTAVHHFSCPGGRHNRRVSWAARKAGYHTVATSRIQKNCRNSDLFALGRVAVMRSISLHGFEQICKGNSFWRMQLEVQLREATKKLLGNSMYDRLRAAVLRERLF